MKLIFNLLLLVVCGGLIYLIFSNIKEPIVFDKQLQTRQGAVVKQLEKIRTAQEVYKRMTGEYASSFDSLKHVLRNDSIELYKIIGNLDDETTETKIETLYVSARDSVGNLGISIDSLDFVPFGEPGATYAIDADTLTFQNTLVNVVEVGIQKSKYMGKYADPKYKKYNPFYDPNDMLKFGDMDSPNTSGNWRK